MMVMVNVPQQQRDMSWLLGQRTWVEAAACVGRPEVFDFGWMRHEDGPARWRAAYRVCAGCPVRRECFLSGLTEWSDELVWGGVHPEQMRDLKRRVFRGDPAGREQRLAAVLEDVGLGGGLDAAV